jgi:hypothetical protein
MTSLKRKGKVMEVIAVQEKIKKIGSGAEREER